MSHEQREAGDGTPMDAGVVRRSQTVAALVVVAALVLTVLGIAYPIALRLPLMDGEFLVYWRSTALRRAHPWIVFALAAAGLAGWRALRQLGKGLPAASWRPVHALEPCALAPVLVAWSQCGPWLGATVAGVAIPLGVPALMAWMVERAVGPLDAVATDRDDLRRGGWRWLLAYFVFLLALGLYFNGRAGEDTGDEAHYLTQLTSLVRDGDLMVGNNLPEALPPPGPGRSGKLAMSHLIEPEAERCYSYHAFGLPLLAWPFGVAGFFGRQLALALIGAVALWGCWAICIAAGAPRRASLLVALSIGLSFAWAVYAIRFLPEILGCGLLAWAFWGMMVQMRVPWRSMAVTLACCGYLPYAHTRFAVPSLVIAFFYGLRGLFVPERLRTKLLRLALFCVGYAAFGLFLLRCHAKMYGAGGAYAYGDILLSYPLALWGIVADHRGLLSVLPALAWYLVAGGVVFSFATSHRRDAGVAWAVVASVLLTSCSNSAALGGACVPGRYLLTVVPLLLPAAALALARVGVAGRIWFYFLSLLSTSLLAATTLLLRKSMGSFILPLNRLARFLGFHALWHPLVSVRTQPASAVLLWSYAFVLAVLLASLLAMHRPRRRGVLAVATLGVVVGLYGGARVHALTQTARVTSNVLLGNAIQRGEFLRVPAASVPRDLFEAMGTQHFHGARAPQLLTNRDLGRAMVDGVHSLPWVPVNDWRGRSYRWYAMHTPIRSNVDGGVAIRVVGIVHGGVRATFAMRQGTYTLEDAEVAVTEGPFEHTWLVPTRRGRGAVMPLVRLEVPEGTVRIKQVLVAPYSPTLMSGGRFTATSDGPVHVLATDGRHEPQ